jgi:hypothetical protein
MINSCTSTLIKHSVNFPDGYTVFNLTQSPTNIPDSVIVFKPIKNLSIPANCRLVELMLDSGAISKWRKRRGMGEIVKRFSTALQGKKD